MSNDYQAVGNVATSICKCSDTAEDNNYCLSLPASLAKSAVISYCMLHFAMVCVYVQASVCVKVMALSPWNRCPKQMSFSYPQ